ncbi:hypothetical protein B0H11DRAFT_2321206 [Mycena galericulata]|nr:hypothetical protein B0H11DRAFT_2321206 [Mycena galericulata]
MATRTLTAIYEAEDDSISRTRTILCHAKNVKEIYYQFEDELEATPSDSEAGDAPAPTPAAAAPFTAAPPVVAAAPSGPATTIEDKLKKRLDEGLLSKSIKDLKGEELPLEEIGAGLASGFGGALGKYTTGLVSRVVGGKMPGGFNSSAIKAYLSKSWGLGSSRADGVLLLATTMEPAEAKLWLDGIVAIYAQRSGISLALASTGGGGGGAAGGPTINSEEFTKFQYQEKFAAQLRDSCAGETALDQEKANVLALQTKLDNIAKEHGDDALLMYYDIIFGRLTTVDRDITARCIALMNRANPELLLYTQYNIDQCDPNKGDNYKLAKQFAQQLLENVREVVGKPPLYKDVTSPTAPHTEVTSKGEIVYSEVVRENVRKLEAYVEEMASSDTISGAININKVQDVLKLWTVVKSQPGISQEQKNRIKALYEGGLTSATSVLADKEYSSNLTGVYLDILHEIATSRTTCKDKNTLLTGIGKRSIGVKIVKGLLSGGAHVVITTSRYNRSTVEYYQSIFQIMDLDSIIPFAGVPENGREIDGLDAKSEFTHHN